MSKKTKGRLFLIGFLLLFAIGLLFIPEVQAESVTGSNYSSWNQPTGTFSIIDFNWTEGTFSMGNASENTGSYAQSLNSLPDNATSVSDTSVILTLEENISATTNENWTIADAFTYRTIFNDSIILSYSDCLYNNTAFDSPTDNLTVSAGLISVNLSNCINANDTVVMRFVYNITVSMLVSPTISIYYTNSTYNNGITLTYSQDDSTGVYLVGYDFDFTCRVPNYSSLSTYNVNATIYWIPPDKILLSSQDVYLDSTNQSGVTWTNNEAEYDISNFISNTTQIQYNTTWQLGYDIDKYDSYALDKRKFRTQYQVWNTSSNNPISLYLNVSWYEADSNNVIDKIDTGSCSSTYNRYYAERVNTFYHRVLAWIKGSETDSIEVVYWKDPEDWPMTEFPNINIPLVTTIVIAICAGILTISIYFYFKLD